MEQTAQKIKPSLLVIFAVLAVAGGFGNCSQTAVNAILNDMSAELGVAVSVSQWLSTGYILALGVAVPLAAWLQKRFSERTLIMIALVCMAMGSVLSIVASAFGVALAGRVFQAAGSGLVMPTMQTMIMVDMPKERMGLFMGINGVAMGFMVNVGPSIGGIMAETFGWRSFFMLYLVLAVVLMVPTQLCGRKSGPVIGAGPFDFASFFLCSFGFIGLLLGFSNASSLGLTHMLVWLPLAVGGVLLAVFVLHQRRLEHPFISMDIFKNKQFAWGFFGNCVLNASFVGIVLVIPLYVQDLRGGTALDVGVLLLPSAVISLLANLICGWLMDRVGARKVLLCTIAILCVGSIMALFCDEDTPLFYLGLSQTVRAVGVAGSIGPFIGWALSDLPRHIVSDGSAFLSVGRQSSASLGTSLMVLLIVAISAAGAPALAYQAAFGFSVVFALLTLAVVILKVR